MQLVVFFDHLRLVSSLQSAYRSKHLGRDERRYHTERAVLKVILCSWSRGSELTMQCMLDLSAARSRHIDRSSAALVRCQGIGSFLDWVLFTAPNPISQRQRGVVKVGLYIVPFNNTIIDLWRAARKRARTCASRDLLCWRQCHIDRSSTCS